MNCSGSQEISCSEANPLRLSTTSILHLTCCPMFGGGSSPLASLSFQDRQPMKSTITVQQITLQAMCFAVNCN